MLTRMLAFPLVWSVRQTGADALLPPCGGGVDQRMMRRRRAGAGGRCALRERSAGRSGMRIGAVARRSAMRRALVAVMLIGSLFIA